jgi:magnesium chelatase family protein
MLARVLTCAWIGLDGAVVEVEVDVAHWLPSLTIVGLPNATVKESSERVRSAISNSGLMYPLSRLTINLAPADLRKGGSAYDLPIAVGILAASEQVFPPDERALIIGELSLDGSVRHVNGVLVIASLAHGEGITDLYVPARMHRKRPWWRALRCMLWTAFGPWSAIFRGWRPFLPSTCH